MVSKGGGSVTSQAKLGWGFHSSEGGTSCEGTGQTERNGVRGRRPNRGKGRVRSQAKPGGG